uniref:tRNA (guanine(10)-N(2))-methyltransferase TRMT11 n=1 Tax=Caenorhabditis tropicalis TaxID=1561998 RepID=A0A1I7TKS4_9PELO
MFPVLVVFSQSHLDFRKAEFEAICSLFCIKVDNLEDHLFVMNFESHQDVEKLLSRSVLVKFALDLSLEVSTYNDLYEKIEKFPNIIGKYDKLNESFAMRFFAIGKKKKLDGMERIKAFLDIVQFNHAPISLSTPKNELYLVESYLNPTDEQPSKIFFGRMLGEGRSELKTKYNLRDRCYIGNTTMDPELSFIQANLAMIRSGDIVLDPFVGTGGLILPAAEFGAFVMGTEINYQTARAQGKSSRQGVKIRNESESIQANFEQYKTEQKLLGIMIADSSKHGIWSSNAMFDAIVADPPYGVREKATKTVKNKEIESAGDYIRYQQKEEYNLESAFCDLLNLAAHILVKKGRVSFWYPVILERFVIMSASVLIPTGCRYCSENLPQHPAMELVSNCEQSLTRKTSRRLLTYQKVRQPINSEECEIQKTGVSHYRSFLFTSKIN